MIRAISILSKVCNGAVKENSPIPACANSSKVRLSYCIDCINVRTYHQQTKKSTTTTTKV